MVQVAKGMGAKVVVGIDINAEKLKLMEGFGADATSFAGVVYNEF